MKGKSLRDHLEVINHKEAIDYIDDIVSKNIDISERVIKDLHPIELAAEFHFRYVHIHPLIDDNGKNARLLMNLTSPCVILLSSIGGSR